MKPRRHHRPYRHAHCAALLALLLCSAPALAQLQLPSLNLPLPQRLGPLDTDVVRDRAERLLERAPLSDLRHLRLEQVGRLLQRHPDLLEADPRGEPAVRGEILAWSPAPSALAAAGVSVIREERLAPLGVTVLVLRVPAGAATAAVLEQLRSLDPEGGYDFNHVYTGSGSTRAAEAVQGAGAPGGQPGRPAQVGLVDGGVDSGHEVFRESRVRRWGCGDASYPSAHGTAVGALMVGKAERFRGVMPGATLFAADIYCDRPTGGSADRIAAALGWLAAQDVGVINISLVGPPNRLLERVVGAMVGRGHLLVAAVGNDGPAAPPLYPASYPGVVGVSAVDRAGRVLPEAARGPQVMFAAPGHHMVSAAPGTPPWRTVRGTSFAAPIVAAMLAGSLARPDPARAGDALQALAQQASGSAANTVSNVLGHGVVGAAFRTDPSAFR